MSDAPRPQIERAPTIGERGLPAEPTAVPPRSSRFRPVVDRYGVRLALVFGTHAPGGLCPYAAAEKCHHCDIGAGEGARFDIAKNRHRLAWFRVHHAEVLSQVAHLVLFNSGSVLNPRELPRELLDEILDFADSLPALRVVSLDSREVYITARSVEHSASRISPRRVVRSILGLETANDWIRNNLLEKQMPRFAIERAFQAVALAAGRVGPDRVGLDVNIVVAGPGTTDESAVTDAVETARFAFGLGRKHGVAIDLNLHPYYPSARGRERFPGHGRCALPVLARAVESLCALRDEWSPDSGLFIGWEDEGHDREPQRRADELALAGDAFDRFNRTQRSSALGVLELGTSS